MDRELFYGDNLEVLRRHIPAESVDLIYLDPPFNSDQNYNVLFRERDGARSAAQIKAFDDTWRWDAGAAAAYQEAIENGADIAVALRALHAFLGRNDLMAYLAMMAPRLSELHRVLKPGGALYLHCDPTASHYLKLLLDGVFGHRAFMNEIIWSYRRWPTKARRFQRMHDVILFYVKSGCPAVFNVSFEPNSPSYMKRFKGMTQKLDPQTGTRKLTIPKPSRGLPERDVWDIKIIPGSGKERLGYPTQKPEALLERIINASSNPGDVVLDPFCGCGTAIAAAERLGRKWIGIDVTHLAIGLIKSRLSRSFGLEERRDYAVTGEPTSAPDAERLAAEDPYQFQCWILGLVGARPAVTKKGPDAGIDGRRVFVERERGSEEEIIFSVKAGKLALSHVRDLRGVIAREDAAIGVLLCCHEPTSKMRAEAAAAGVYQSAWGRHPRLQILTMAQLLAGAKVDCPAHLGLDRTIKPAPPRRPPQAQQLELPAVRAQQTGMQGRRGRLRERYRSKPNSPSPLSKRHFAVIQKGTFAHAMRRPLRFWRHTKKDDRFPPADSIPAWGPGFRRRRWPRAKSR